ncbi:MAG: hypothetical protein KC777_16290 [Cyanobacteria bacterium HKST-UBA02]|nr:hypothetical protein [Cyanobacteria bacterium HKST-UBA02]
MPQFSKKQLLAIYFGAWAFVLGLNWLANQILLSHKLDFSHLLSDSVLVVWFLTLVWGAGLLVVLPVYFIVNQGRRSPMHAYMLITLIVAIAGFLWGRTFYW